MSLNGCPYEKEESNDSDGDGIVDEIDRCPSEYGPVENNGCPDSDGDGIADIDDRCPNVIGFKSNQGCPKTIETSNESIIVDPKSATYKTSYGDVLEYENLGALYKELLVSGELNTPFIAFEVELKGGFNAEKFEDSPRLIINLNFLKDNSQKRIQFETGKYFFSERNNPSFFEDFERSIDDLNKALRFLFIELGEGADILIQGVADNTQFDNSPYLTPPYDGIDYSDITYYSYNSLSNVFDPNSQKLTNNRFTNKELPNLRGKFLLEVFLNASLPQKTKNRLILYEGMVTSRAEFKDRHGSVLLAIDWNAVEIAAEKYQKKLLAD